MEEKFCHLVLTPDVSPPWKSQRAFSNKSFGQTSSIVLAKIAT
ncbi:MAG: hypothetical protein QXY87_09700 [Saccharolobus sp.]|nr:hypothetical protein [Saccharolobus shibatae]